MAMRRAIMAIAGALALVLAIGLGPAAARDLPSNGLTRSDILTWLQGHGYTANMQHDNTANDDYIATSTNGVNWGIYVYDCVGDVCKSIQYSVGWGTATDVTEDKLNDWNRDERYARAYHNAAGDVFAEYDIDVIPGGTWEQLDHTLGRWNDILAEFRKHIGR
jgi:hypothetical protein